MATLAAVAVAAVAVTGFLVDRSDSPAHVEGPSIVDDLPLDRPGRHAAGADPRLGHRR